MALFAPVGTAPAYVNSISAAVGEIAAMPAIRTNLANIGFSAAANNPQQMADAVRSELDLWRPIIKESGFQVD